MPFTLRATIATAALQLATAPAFADTATHGILNYGTGRQFQTTVYEARLIGMLPAQEREPYLVFSGRGCDECDINRSVYIHSPSDPPMSDGETSTRYLHPGRYHDYMSNTLVEKVRMFIGNCTDPKTVSVVWFITSLLEDGRWMNSTFVAKVERKTLLAGVSQDSRISLATVQVAVTKKTCREVPGRRFSTEP